MERDLLIRGMAGIQTGFFTHEIQLRRLYELDDPFRAVDEAVDFEMFRPPLDTLLSPRTTGPGRPPWDRVRMFKILVLQIVRGLSDEKLEFDLIDSASAQRFAGLFPHDKVPDSRTVWLFRDTPAKAKLPGGADAGGTDGVRALFKLFHRELAAKGLLCREGKTVDAMIVEVPRQRNPKEENKQIKNGEVPADWRKQPRKLAQKHTDAGKRCQARCTAAVGDSKGSALMGAGAASHFRPRGKREVPAKARGRGWLRWAGRLWRGGESN